MKQILTLILPCLLALPRFASAAEWQSFFDGKSLAGWRENPECGCLERQVEYRHLRVMEL